MSISEVIIESLNCLAESMVIVFYLYNMMKEDYRFRKKSLVPAVILCFISLDSVTLFLEYPWVHLIATFILMMAISSIMFECKFGTKIFCSLIFLIVILASESLPMGILYMLNFGSPLEQLTSGAGRYIGMFCSKLFCFWFSVYIIEYSKQAERYSNQKLAVDYTNTYFKRVYSQWYFCIIWFKSQTDDKLFDYCDWITGAQSVRI